MPGITIRLARPGDEGAVLDFLCRHADSSLYLRYFLAQGGLVDDGKPLQGTYAVALDGATIVGVAMHDWLGAVILQAPDHAADLAKAVALATGRKLFAVVGPYSQVREAHRHLAEGPGGDPAKDGLFVLNIEDMTDPDMGTASWMCRTAGHKDLSLLVDWRFRYELESTGLPDAESTRDHARAVIVGHVDLGEAFLLEVDGQPVSLCTRTARAVESIQIGGVWTPPGFRNRGYGRAVVAGTLRKSALDGVTRAVLFTDNPAARRSYEALGFRQTGEYGVAIFSA